MYPDLSYLFHDILGTQPDNWLSIFKTFGFFLAMSFLVSALVYYIELKRKSKEGYFRPTRVQVVEGLPATPFEIGMNALVGFILAGKGAYAYMNYEAFRHDPASVVLSSKINLVAGLIGAAALGALTWWDARRRQTPQPQIREVDLWPHDRISEITVWAAVGGIVGAKLFDVFDNIPDFLQDPLGTLFSGGGLAFFGGLILGFIAVVWYIYRQKIPFWPAADAVAPALTAGYGFGRVGCQLSGDGDWGIVNIAAKPGWMSFLPDWMWAYKYPHHVINSPHTDPSPSVRIDGCDWDYCMELSSPVFPTPFYETLMMLLIFGVLWTLRKRLKTPGMLFFIYLALIAAERFIIEKIRVNVPHQVLGITLTQAEIISIGIFLVSLGGMWYVNKRNKNAAGGTAS